MQGADRINEEFEVGYDQYFERRWRFAEQVGRWIMLLFILAGLVGLLGRGPFSHRRSGSISNGLMVDFEPVSRSQAAIQVTLHLNDPTSSQTVDVFGGTNIVEPMGLQRVEPPAAQTRLIADGMVMTIPIPPGTHDAKLRLMLMPLSLGPNELIARVNDGVPQRWTQFVLP